MSLMKPQVGDVWHYRDPDSDSRDATVLLLKYLNYFPGLNPKVTLSFWGFDMLNNIYDVYLFHEPTCSRYWSKV